MGALPGVSSADVNLPLSRARIVLDPAVATIAKAAAAIRDAGYEVPDDVIDEVARGGAARLQSIELAEQDEVRGLRRDATIAIALTVPLIAIAMAIPASTATVILQLVLGTIVVLGPGWRYLRGGWIAVRHRAPDMNTLIALGAGAAWLSSAIVAARWLAGPRVGTPDIYFEAGAAIVAFVMIGKLLESRARARLSEAVRALISLAPARARKLVDRTAPPFGGAVGRAQVPVLDRTAPPFGGAAGQAQGPAVDRTAPPFGGAAGQARPAVDRTAPPFGGAAGQARPAVDGAEVELEASALEPGDVMAVRPGERLAADGTIVEGSSALDESLLTGESLPVDKSEGSPVYAGTLNFHGALLVRVARAGADSALAHIARAVEDAQGSKAPIARLADRVSAWFVPSVLAIAALTFAAWSISGSGPSIALERMIAVLVIACPCALGLATPAAVAVGTSRGAELGVLFKGGVALEVASHIDVVCLDKTGTLTAGKPALVGEISDDLLRLVASAEQASEHPIARAIVAGATARNRALVRPTDVTIEPGGGLSARVDGHLVRVGTRAYAGAVGHQAVAPLASISYIVVDGEPAGTVAVADRAAPEAGEAIAQLREMGIDVVMVTGDREAAAKAIADEVGITRIHADVRPTAKAAIVAGERAGGRRVAMVGDGINDAPALAAADLGIAIGSGADLAAAAADVTLLRGGIAALPTALMLARATLRTIRRNLIAAFAYNAICIPIAAAGLLSPMLAAGAMSLSSVSVLLSSLRLRRFMRR